MRPVVLRLQGFMAFAARQEVDFRVLQHDTLMMIAGETGAGKTALLDAMTYALFGASTGGERKETNYRSDHVDDGTESYVDFQFRLRGQIYRVLRMPPQKGTSIGKYELYTLDDIDAPNPTLVASSKSKVTKKVTELLGYNLEQFRSVVILPQGQFRDFLQAKAEKKSQILSSLLRTLRYKLLQERLQALFNEVKNAQADTRKDMAGILERAGVETESDLVAAVVLLQENISTQRKTVFYKKAATTKAQQAFDSATQTQRTFEALDVAHAHLKATEEAAGAQKQRKATLALARRASQVQTSAKLYSLRLAELEKTSTLVPLAEATLTKATQHLEQSLKRYQEESARKPEQETLQKRVTELNLSLPNVRDLKELQEQLCTGQVQAKESEALRDTAKTTHSRLEITLKELQSTLEELSQCSKQLPAATENLAYATERRVQYESLNASKEEVAAAQQADSEAQAIYEQAQATATTSDNTFRTLYAAHLADYAAKLAGELVEGTPCQVCGSTTHPSPKPMGTDGPDKAQVETARTAADHAKNAERDAQERLLTTKNQVTQCKQRVQDLRRQLGTHADLGLEALKDREETLKNTVEETRQAHTLLPTTTRDVEEQQAELAQAQEEIQRHTTALQEQTNRNERLAGQIQGLMKTAPKGIETLEALELKIAETTGALQTLKTAFTTAESEWREAEKQQAEAMTARTHALESLTECQTNKETALTAFQTHLKEQAFTNESAYAQALRSRDDQNTLETEINAYEEGKNILLGQIRELRAALGEKKRPDLSGLQEALALALAAEETEMEALTALQNECSPKEENIAHLKNLREQNAEREAEYQLLGSLSNTATGGCGIKITFERWVLAGLLDQVLIFANRRFTRMSGGRYTLERAGIDAKRDGRAQAGLELLAHDSFTGKARDASTLSGGEGFQASLSLALGLAEVVQAQSGGVELGAMFIDEGFGTQSEQALDSVLETLEGLQSTGRIVGFISHVESMRDRIPTKLLVTKTIAGSSVRWSTPNHPG